MELKQMQKSIHGPCRFFLIIFLLFGGQAFSQEPYSIDWSKESIHLGAGAAGMGVWYFANKSVNPLSPQDISALRSSDINAFDRSATTKNNGTAGSLSDAGLAFNAVFPAVLLLGSEGRKEALTIGTMYFETMLYTTMLTQVTKVIFLRNRPFTYNPDASMGDKGSTDARMSFFSGHTAAAFASATFLTTVFSKYYPNSSWKVYVIGLSFASAAATGICRYEAGKHFPSDIIVGALVGSAIGYVIPELHKVDENKTVGSAHISPGFSPAGINLTIVF
jgi:membrane-associated phospholipid phosphatase